jgi:DNA-binding SARP family transcriptional activator/tetratricopeptide (TPR) repeat protein
MAAQTHVDWGFGGAWGMEFRLLGPVGLWCADREVPSGRPRQRSVLAVLTMAAGQVVELNELVERVWGDRAPDEARSVLYTYVSRLRRVLAQAGLGEGRAVVRRSGGGYLLDVDPLMVDVHRARRLVTLARGVSGDDRRALALWDEATGLWRGVPLAGLDGGWVELTRARLARERVAVVAEACAVRLRLGQPGEVVEPLTDLLAEQPLDESLAEQLMLALYRSGRQADALACYQQLRARLAEHLGVDPSPALQQRYQQVLTADPALDGIPAMAADRPPVPRQLPAPPPVFVGRVAELAELDTVLDSQTRPGGTMVISAIGGAGGIGKTVLALQWAHQRLDRFPDGQLYVNLRGFDPSGSPTAPQTAVPGFLQALGVPLDAIPTDLDTQVGLYRSLVADKRILVFLDNAYDTAQVEPLLPGGTNGTAVITSRNRLSALAVRGAHLLDLDVLTADEAAQLLTRQLPAARVAAEPDAVTDLLTWCAGNPLAISIAAARSTQHPDFPLAMLADELRDSASRLDALDAGDLAANLRAVLSWSYRALPPQATTMFRLLGLAPGPDIGLPAAASLAALPPGRTRTVLRDLETAHLVTQHLPGRYRMHDLTRLYAAERAAEDIPEPDRQAALRRVIDFYLHTAHHADRHLYPMRQTVQLAPTVAGCHPYRVRDSADALEWFTAEHLCLLASQQAAATSGCYRHVWQLAFALNTFRWRGHLHDNVTVWQAALAAADNLGESGARTLANRQLGAAYALVGRYREALDHLHRALTLAETRQDRSGQAHGHRALAWAWGQQGDHRRSLAHATDSLRLYRSLDKPALEAVALNNVGWCAAQLGEYDKARAHCEAALRVFRRLHNLEGEAHALDSLGYIASHTGQHTQAIDAYQQAIALSQELGHNYQVADSLAHLGVSYAEVGQHEQAHLVWRQALTLYQSQHRTSDAERVQRLLDSSRAVRC